MNLFLERAKAFPGFRFAIINADLLPSKVLERLVYFLSDREIAAAGVHFHCIQQGRTLHPSPWVAERVWDDDSLSSSVRVDCSSWKSHENPASTVVWSPHCGTGKTRLIRDRMRAAAGDGSRCSSIAIHERSTVGSLIRSLKSKFSSHAERNTLHVSFSFLPGRGENKEWLCNMNHFFLGMFVLNSVYDPVSAASFTFSGHWDFLLEFPSGRAHRNTEEWLQSNIPIVAAYSSFQQPVPSFVIDEAGRRVATYLRALSDGTINRKFEPENKRVVLVLDCSGSMLGTPFADAVRNALAIFDSHVMEGDVRIPRIA